MCSVFPSDLALAFVWSRESCTWRHHLETREEYWLKPFRKVTQLGYDLDRVLMADHESHKLNCTRLALARLTACPAGRACSI